MPLDPSVLDTSETTAPAVTRQRTKVSSNLDSLLESEGANHLAPVVNAIYGQESGSGSNSKTSVDGARGPMQIMPATFKQLARQGESIDNPEDNLRVGIRLIKALGDKFNNDPARIAAGYFTGEGNVNPTGDRVLRQDHQDGNGKRASSYVQDVLGRIGGEKAPAVNGLALAKQIANGGGAFSDGVGLARRIAGEGSPEAPAEQAPAAAEPTLIDKAKQVADFGVEATKDIGQRLLEPFKRDAVPGSVTNAGVPETGRDFEETGGVPLQAERLQQFRTIARDQPKTAAKIAQRDDWSGQAMRAVLKQQGIQVERIKAGDNMTAPNAGDIAQRATMRPAPELTAGGEDNAKIAYNQKGDIGKNLAHAAQGVQQGVLDVRDGVIGAGQFALRLVGAEDVADELQKHQVDLKARAGNLDLPSTAGYGAKTAQAVARSLTMNVPGLLTGATAPALTAMGIQSFGQEFGTGKQAGMNDAEATVRAGIFSAAEVLGERFGLGDALKGLKAAANGMPTSELVNHFGRAMVKEIPGEELTSTLQFLADKYLSQGLHQNATFDDYLRLTADTLVQTVLQSGVMMGGGAAVSKTVQAIDAKFPNATLGRAMREAVEGGSFDPAAVDRAARLALDPNASNATEVLPEATGFAPQPVAVAPEQPTNEAILDAPAVTSPIVDELAAIDGLSPAPVEQPDPLAGHTPASLEFLANAHPDQAVREQATQALAQPRFTPVTTQTETGQLESLVSVALEGQVDDSTVHALAKASAPGGGRLTLLTPAEAGSFAGGVGGVATQAEAFAGVINAISGRNVVIATGTDFRGAITDRRNVILNRQQGPEGLTAVAFHELRHALVEDHPDLSGFWSEAVRQQMDTSDSALLHFLTHNYSDAAFTPERVAAMREKGRSDGQILNAILAQHATAIRYEEDGRGSRRDWALEELEADALGDAANREGVIRKALDYMAKVDIGLVQQFAKFVQGVLKRMGKGFGSEGYIKGSAESEIRARLEALDKAAAEVLGKYASRTQNQKRMQSATPAELLLIKKSHPDDVVRDMASAQLKEREKEAAHREAAPDRDADYKKAKEQQQDQVVAQEVAKTKAAGTDDGTPTAMQRAMAKAKGTPLLSPARGETAAHHKMQITREERELADKTKLSRDELKRVTAGAMQFSLKPKLVELEVRRIKARFPEAAGWAPLEFLRVDPKTMAKKAKENNPLPSDAIFFVEQGYKFHTDQTGKDNAANHDERVTQLAAALAGEITGKYVAAQNGDQVAGVIMRQSDWYQALRGKLRTTFGGFGDFLAQLLGPTSANNPVEPNFKYGVEALKLATSGKWDGLFRDVFTWKADIQAAAANLDDVIERVTAEGGKGVKNDPRVLLALDELKKASVYKGEMPLRENGKQFGMATAGIQSILAEAWGDKAHGDAPKTKNYYQNIMGRTTGATIDVWAARTLRRLANESIGDFPRIPPVAETAVAGQVLTDNTTSGSEFGFGQEVFERAAEQLRNSGIEQFKSTTPDAVQAMIWFAEKELWARRDWTTKVGEEGSIEHEMLLAGYPDRGQVDAWRVAARAGHPNPDAKAYQGTTEKQIASRRAKFEKDVAKWKEAKRIAAEELAKIERYPDRFVAGVTTEIPDAKPTDGELAAVARELEAAITDEKIMAMRAQSSVGEFMGDFERTLDVEFVARNGYNAVPVWNKLVEIGQREGQQAVFLSRLLREDELTQGVDLLKYRPGVELYFTKPITLDQAQPLMDMINAAGVHGMTMATEGRRTPSAQAGETQLVSGIRMQHIPEFSLGYGYNVSMTNAEIVASVEAARDRMEDLVSELRKRPDVSASARHWYETKVHFYGNQDTETVAGAGPREGAGQVWSGQPIREGLESADRFARDGAAPLAARRAELGQLPRRGAEGARLSPARPGSAGAAQPDGGRAPGLPPQFGQARPGAVQVRGIHFSGQARSQLSGAAYGTGLKGEEGARLSEAGNADLRSRVYFYVDEGQGVFPEAGVGAQAHDVDLKNLYDLKADTLGLRRQNRDASAMERAIKAAGFDGYYAPEIFTRQGVAVLVGDHTVPVRQLGLGYRGGDAVTSQATTKANPLAERRDLPGGRMSGAEWKKLVPEAKNLEDNKSYYKDDIRFSPARFNAIADAFTQRVTEALANSRNTRPVLIHSDTPASMQILGWANRPLLVEASELAKIANKPGFETDEKIGALVHDLGRPGAMFWNEKQGSLNILRREDMRGAPALIAVRADAPVNRERAHLMVTAHRLENQEALLRKITSGELKPLYLDQANPLIKMAMQTRKYQVRTAEMLAPENLQARDAVQLGTASRLLSPDDLVKWEGDAPRFSPGRNTQIEEEAFELVRRNTDALIAEYRRRFQEVIDPDNVKKLFPAFEADPSLAAAVHEPSSTLAKAIYAKALKENAGKPVTFTAGGGGSGKSEAMPVALATAGLGGGGLTYDSTLSSFKSASSRIDQALETGANVTVVYTNRGVEDAFKFAMGRSRVVPITVLAEAHVGASNTIRQLAARYFGQPKVSILVINNLGDLADMHLGALGDVPRYDYNEVERKLHAIAKDALANGDITQARYDALVARRDGESAQGSAREVQAGQQGQELGRAGGRAGQEVVRASPARKIIARIDAATDGLSNLPNQFNYLSDRYLALGKIARADEIVREIQSLMGEATSADKQAVYDYLTTPGATTRGIADPKIADVAKRTKDTINYVGDALVARGLLDPASRAKYKDQYLPRMYLKHLLDDKDFAVFGSGKKPSEMGYLKERKDIDQDVRDLILGEIKDPGFLSANAIGRAVRDMAILDWLGQVSQNNDWVYPQVFVDYKGQRVSVYWLKAEAERIENQIPHYTAANQPRAAALVANMRQVANTALGAMQDIDHNLYKQIPNTNRYGLLRGMWIRREIYNDVMGVSGMSRPENFVEDWLGFNGKGAKLTSMWKFAKVALNPPGQVRNFVSNMVMLQLSGVGLHKLPIRLVQAVNQIKTNGRYWKVAKKYGVTESTFTAQELYRAKEALLSIQATHSGNPIAYLKHAAAKLLNAVGDLYQFTEALGKTVKIIDEMEKGKTEAEAALEAQKWLFDYSLVPQSVRLLRAAPVGAPFITYQVKVLPRLLEVATTAPWRLLPWVAAFYGMAQFVAATFGVDDDDLEKLKKSLPEWLQNRDHTMLLPVRDGEGRVQVADLGYFFPWTFYSQAATHLAQGDLKKGLVDDIGGQFSAPILGAISGLMKNYDSFTKKPIYAESDPTSYQAAAIANFAYDLMAPPFISSHGFASPMGLVDKKYGGKMVQAVTGTTNKFGDPRATEAQALAGLFGLNFYGMDPEHTRATNLQVMAGKVREAELQLKYRLMDRGLSGEQRTKYITDYRDQMTTLAEDVKKYAAESEVPEQLKVQKK